MVTLTPDELLTTTRSVRRRLDFNRPVSRQTIEECLELALQAPNGSNRQTWHWLLVDDSGTIAELARLYSQSMDDYVASLGDAVGENYVGANIPRAEKITDSVMHLRENFHRLPAVVIPLLAGRTEQLSAFFQASMWGSVIQAGWSLMLAFRSRGLGSAWTTVHLWREREVAELLQIPEDRYTQVAMLPVAYTLGTDFKPAYREPVEKVSSWNRFGNR